MDAVTRASLAVLTRLFDWRSTLVVVQPATIVRWHRAGWRLLWRMKSRPRTTAHRSRTPRADPADGRGQSSLGRRAHCQRIVAQAGRAGLAANGSKVLAQATSRSAPRRSALVDLPEEPRKGVLACDFFVAVTATFRLLYVFVVIEARKPPSESCERDSPSERCLDAAADERSGLGHR